MHQNNYLENCNNFYLPNGATLEEEVVPPDALRRRFVADRRSMKAEVRSLDAILSSELYQICIYISIYNFGLS